MSALLSTAFWPCRAVSVLALAALGACTSVTVEQNLARVNDTLGGFAEAPVSLVRTASQREAQARAASELLAAPLGQKEAEQLALLHSPALQALLAQGWADAADAAQLGRLANPVFSYERLAAGSELELSRALSLGLLDVLTLPLRQGMAAQRLQQAQLRLAGEVVDQITRLRQAWVRAVAAQQNLQYAHLVFESAEASAELARRMQATGNFNRISRAREQAFYADAATRLATASHQSTAAREELVRQLGLDEAQAARLQLPPRLPDLPAQAWAPEDIGQRATRERLDIRLAQASLAASGRAQGLNTVTSLTDIELTARRKTNIDSAAGTRSDPRGYEVAIRLPLLDWGGLQRDAWNARTLAAAAQLEATLRTAGSNLRESYSAYRTAHDIARHYRDEVVPLRKLISEENQLRYNGMLIGVFELLADARDQVGTVVAAINAEQQFWLADAALQAALIGRPTSTVLSVSSTAPSVAGGH